MSHLNTAPTVLSKRIFSKVLNIPEVIDLSKEEKAMYDSNLKARWDYENSIAFAKEEAAAQAATKARHEEALNIAGELKKEGLSSEFIAKTTKLPIEEIEKL